MNVVAPSHHRISVEIVFDFVCPWCCIGVNRMLNVFDERQDVDIVYKWRPFLLNPDFSSEGMELRAYLRALHGCDERGERLLLLIESLARQCDSFIRIDRIHRVPSTLRAHRLVEWAASRGDCTKLVMGLFEAYFREGEDIGDTATLADIAERHGFDRELVTHFLSTETLAGTVVSGQINAQKAGIHGVPSLIIEGFALTGVHEAPTLNRLLDAALSVTRSPQQGGSHPATFFSSVRPS
ncbi:MAG: DsbA family oxidoreductase [Acetobacter sp.]